MVDFIPGQAVIDDAQRKCEADAVTLLKRIRKFSMTEDIGVRAALHIFNRISFAVAKEDVTSSASIEKLINQRVADVMAVYEANQSNGMQPKMKLVAVLTIGIDKAHEMSWKDLMKLMIEVYYLRNEIQKLENELWNLTVKGTDVAVYTRQQLQEMSLLCHDGLRSGK
ncbi:hypothetical protein Tco_0717319 [Tanacetum coccineum]